MKEGVCSPRVQKLATKLTEQRARRDELGLLIDEATAPELPDTTVLETLRADSDLVSGRHTLPLVVGVIHRGLDLVEGEVWLLGRRSRRGTLARQRRERRHRTTPGQRSRIVQRYPSCFCPDAGESRHGSRVATPPYRSESRGELAVEYRGGQFDA